MSSSSEIPKEVYNIQWTNSMSIQRKSYTITGGEMKKEEDFIFPADNWYLKLNDENRDLVNNWRTNIIKYSNEPCSYPYIYYNGPGVESGGVGFGPWFEISTSQFKEYVLNISTQEITKEPEDLSYLIEFLNNKQIK